MNLILHRAESAPGVPRRAVTFFQVAQKESNQRKSALNTSSFVRMRARDESGLNKGLTRYGHEFRLHRGAQRLGHIAGRARPFGSVQTQALPDQSDLCARTEIARAYKPKDPCWALFLCLLSFWANRKKVCRLPGRDPAPMWQQKNLPGHSRRRLPHVKNSLGRATR